MTARVQLIVSPQTMHHQSPPIVVPTRRRFQKLMETASLKWSAGWDLENSSVFSTLHLQFLKHRQSSPHPEEGDAMGLPPSSRRLGGGYEI